MYNAYTTTQVNAERIADDVNTHGVEWFVERIFQNARHIWFEDGMDNPFILSLAAAYRHFGIPFLEAFEQRLLAKVDREDVVAEAIRWVGHAGDDLPRPDCLNRCVRWGLEHTLIIVRDAASIAISCMDDPLFIGDIEAALKKEGDTWQQNWLKQVLVELQAKQGTQSTASA